jgi:hypothetical protein
MLAMLASKTIDEWRCELAGCGVGSFRVWGGLAEEAAQAQGPKGGHCGGGGQEARGHGTAQDRFVAVQDGGLVLFAWCVPGSHGWTRVVQHGAMRSLCDVGAPCPSPLVRGVFIVVAGAYSDGMVYMSRVGSGPEGGLGDTASIVASLHPQSKKKWNSLFGEGGTSPSMTTGCVACAPTALDTCASASWVPRCPCSIIPILGTPEALK